MLPELLLLVGVEVCLSSNPLGFLDESVAVSSYFHKASQMSDLVSCCPVSFKGCITDQRVVRCFLYKVNSGLFPDAAEVSSCFSFDVVVLGRAYDVPVELEVPPHS